MRTAVLVTVALLGGCASTAAIRPAAPQALPVPRGAPPPPFITTFWCGPPLPLFDDRRAAEIADAGFTVVGEPCEGQRSPELNRQALDVAARHGIRVLIGDGRFAEGGERLAAAVAEIKGHPGLAGYFLEDEPVVSRFAGLAASVHQLRSLDPDTLAYVNLLPDFAAAGAGAATYRAYVEQFLATVEPKLLSYDYYPFLNSGDRPTFFPVLALVRELSIAHDVPFMLILQAMPHGPYRDPTEAEVQWQALHAVAYGARGVSYFAYWTPVDVAYQDVMKFRHGLIEGGAPTRHYFEAARVNQTVRAIVDALGDLRSVAVADSRGQVAEPFPLGPLTGVDDASVTGGLFANREGQQAVLLVNRDYRRRATATLRLDASTPLPDTFDLETRTWRRLPSRTLPLAAGGAALLRWTP